MVVTPQSVVQIFKDVPWTNDYKHTRYFNSKADELTYFESKIFKSFTNFTYVREQNVIRIPANADEIYGSNYLRYMNATFGDKWFYAFITDVKYVNNETVELAFEIDLFITWRFELDFHPCYVEREHVNSDKIGEHIIEEDIGTGEIVPQVKYNRFWKYSDDPDRTDYEKGMDLMLQVKPTLVGQFAANQSPFEVYGNQVIPATKSFIRYLPSTDNNALTKQNITDYLTSASFTGAEVGDGYMFPYEVKTSAFVNIGDLGTQHNIKRPSSYPYSRSIYDSHNPAYEPHNNKLLTYPYTYLFVTSSDGNKKIFKWENTPDGYVSFEIIGCAYNVPSCLLKPVNYAYGVDELLDGVPLNEFPKISLGQYDSFSAKNLLQTGTRMASSLLSGNALGFLSETANAFTGLFFDTPDKDFKTVGNSTLAKEEMVGYTFYVMGIHGQNAKVIDDYLTRFGYKVNVIKTPNRIGRKYWNYVKTKECELGGNVPNDALKKIQEMFNSGITLWHVNDVGNFRNSNPIV